MRYWIAVLTAVALTNQAAVASGRTVYRYHIAAAMSAHATFGPADAGFDKANAGGNSGLTANTYDAHDTTGTIALEVVQQTADGTVVFNVSQDGKPPAMCAVSGDTQNVTCESEAHFRNESLMLLRAMSPSIVSSHPGSTQWTSDSNGSDYSEKAQFAIARADAQTVTVRMTRTTEQREPQMTVTLESTVVYDAQLLQPREMHAVVTFTQPGVAATSTAERVDFERVSS